MKYSVGVLDLWWQHLSKFDSNMQMWQICGLEMLKFY